MTGGSFPLGRLALISKAHPITAMTLANRAIKSLIEIFFHQLRLVLLISARASS
jgi:hypothetical protein